MKFGIIYLLEKIALYMPLMYERGTYFLLIYLSGSLKTNYTLRFINR